MNYKEVFAINEIPYNQLKEQGQLQNSIFELNNYCFYEPKLVDDFYLKYFTFNLLFETDILELKDFLEYHYDYCDNPMQYYEILDFKVLPKIEEIIENAKTTFGGGGYYDEKKLDYDFVESEGVIHNGNYEWYIMYHRTEFSNLKPEFRKRIQIITSFILDYKDKSQAKPLKWIAGPSQLGVVISELLNKGYMKADQKGGQVNSAKLARELFKVFDIDDCKSSKTIEIYLSPQNKRNISAKNNFEKLGFCIPDAKFT